MLVMFQGSYYDVPEWAKFLAKDDNGYIYAYENCPVWSDADREYRVESGQFLYICHVNCLEIVKTETA